MSATNEAEPLDIGCETVRLDPNGDVALVIFRDSNKLSAASDSEEDDPSALVPGKRFIVSSNSLTLASPYFRALFSPNFQEGSRVREGGCPDVTLRSDDVEAMEIILSLLHFRLDVVRNPLNVSQLFKIACQCDKYQCMESIRPFLWESFNAVMVGKIFALKTNAINDIGRALTASYIFEQDAHWQTLIFNAVELLPLRFERRWKSSRVHELLPKMIPSIIRAMVVAHNENTHQRLQEIVMELAQSDDLFDMVDGADEQEECTPDLRVFRFLEELSGEGMWPSVKTFRDSNSAAIYARFHRARDRIHEQHQCTAGRECPLKTKITEIATLASQSVSFSDGQRAFLDKLVSFCKREAGQNRLDEMKKRRLEDSG